MKHLLSLVLLCFLLCATCHSQNLRVIDSLKSSLNAPSGMERYESLSAIGIEYYYTTPDSALKYFRKAQAVAFLNGDSIQIVKSTRRCAQSLVVLERASEAMIEYNKTLLVARRNAFDADYMQMLNGLAICHGHYAEYDQALAHLFTALKYNQQVDDPWQLSVTLTNLGYIYFKLKDYAKALDYFRKSEEMKLAIGDDVGLSQVLINISICYAYLNDHANAERYIEKFEEQCNGKCSQQLNLQILFARGLLSFEKKDFEKAENFFQESYDLSEEFGAVRYQLDNIDYLSQIYVATGKAFRAKVYLQKAEQLLEENIWLNLEAIKIYLRFSELSYKAKEFELMAFYQKKYIALSDSMFGESLTNRVRKIETEYLETQSNAKIEAQNEVIRLKEQIITSQSFLIAAVTALAIFLIIFSIALYRISKERKSINNLLETRVLERTRELEHNKADLVNACNQRDLFIDRMLRSINTSLASYKGINDLALREVTDREARAYLERISATFDSLSTSLQQFAGVHKGLSEENRFESLR